MDIQIGRHTARIVFHPRYAVTRCGKVFARRGRRQNSRRNLWNSWKLLRPWLCKGYEMVTIRPRKLGVHQLVLLAWKGKPKRGQTDGRHLDGNPRNNHCSNLKWGTRKENEKDKVQHGRDNKGEKHVFAKLTNAEAKICRELKKRHPEKRSGVIKFLAEWFGVSQPQMTGIAKGRYYA